MDILKWYVSGARKVLENSLWPAVLFTLLVCSANPSFVGGGKRQPQLPCQGRAHTYNATLTQQCIFLCNGACDQPKNLARKITVSSIGGDKMLVPHTNQQEKPDSSSRRPLPTPCCSTLAHLAALNSSLLSPQTSFCNGKRVKKWGVPRHGARSSSTYPYFSV